MRVTSEAVYYLRANSLSPMLIIRTATKKDLPAIQRLHRELFLLESARFDETVNPLWSLSRHARAWFGSQIGVHGECLLVAEVDGQVAGYLSGGLTKRLLMWKPGVYADLYSMCVSKKHRRQGLGKELMVTFFSWCEARQVTNLSVDASIANKAAVAFYEKHGFKPLETRLLKTWK